jgi:small-conductance mechanosensitive channel
MTTAQVESLPPGWLPASLAGAWATLAAYPLLLALAVVAGGVLLALAIRYVAGFWGLRIAKRIPTDLDDELIRLLAGVVPVVLVFLSLMAAVRVLPLGTEATLIINRVLGTLLVIQLVRMGFRAAYIGLRLISTIRDRFNVIEERTIPLFDLVATVVIVAIGAYALLEVWSIDPTAWLASAGLVGIAVGFAAKDTLANLFAGIFIIADAPYKVGDFIVLDSGERGEITKVGIRSTRMLTMDDVEVIVPNALMANQKIVNESGGRWIKSRIRLRVGVAYGSDVDRVVRLLESVPAGHGNVAKDPAPRARMVGFGESSLDFDLLCWIDHPSMRGAVIHELFVDIYKRLSAEGIEIPFPQRDLWVRKVPEGVAALGRPEQESSALARTPMQ